MLGFNTKEPAITSAYPENAFVSDVTTTSAAPRRSILANEAQVSSATRKKSYLSACDVRQ